MDRHKKWVPNGGEDPFLALDDFVLKLKLFCYWRNLNFNLCWLVISAIV